MTLVADKEVSRVTIDRPRTRTLPYGRCIFDTTFKASENPVLDFWLRVDGAQTLALNLAYGTTGIGYEGYSGYENHVINIVGKQVGVAELGDLGNVNDGSWHHIVFDVGHAIETGLNTRIETLGDIRLSLYDHQGAVDLFGNGPQNFPATVQLRQMVLRPRRPGDTYVNEVNLSMVLAPVGPFNDGKADYLAGGSLVSRSRLKGANISVSSSAGRAGAQSLGVIEGRSEFLFRIQVPSGVGAVQVELSDSDGPVLVRRKQTLPPPLTVFGNGTVNLIPTSHNDIGWLDTPEATANWRRDKVIGPAIELLSRYPEYRFGMETNLFLMEYLHRVPAQAGVVRQLISEGRLAFGATYNQPYPSLWPGESLLRQLYFGRKWLREKLGSDVDTVTAWGTDTPTVALQWPQLLAKSGVKYLMLGRFRPGFFDWHSPDGSKVAVGSLGVYWPLKVYLTPPEPVNFALQVPRLLSQWDNYYREHRIPAQFPLSDMTDYQPPTNRLIDLVNRWQTEIQNKHDVALKVKFATGEELMNAVTSEASTSLPKLHGEWPSVWAYIHGPTHHRTVSAGREAAALLVAAESSGR